MKSFDEIRLPFPIVSDNEICIKSFKLVKNEINNNNKNSLNLNKTPGVYCIYNKKEGQIYIGESIQPFNRLLQHLKNYNIMKNDKIIIFSSEKFNKSVIYDIETKLIEYFDGEQRYCLKNTRYQKKHSYYLQESYACCIKEIWNYLIKKGIAEKEIDDIKKESIHRRLSPYKSLNSNQSLIFDEINNENIVDGTKNDNKKEIFWVNGYPGTGKSVLASSLFNNLAKTKNVALVAGTEALEGAFKKALKKLLKADYKKKLTISRANDVINNSFKYDVIIVDEAHRLLKRGVKGFKGLFLKYKHLRKGQNELEELIKKTNKIIVFYDENQIVNDDFVLDKSAIKITKTLTLKEQMRLENGEEFVKFIIDFFDGEECEYISNEYDVKIYTNFANMYKNLKEKSKEWELTRLLSGFTHKWESRKDPEKYDFNIDGIKLRWNNYKNVSSKNWIMSEEAKNLNEVAYYNVIQGFDLQYAGVIIGEDIYLDDNNNIQINEDYVVYANDRPNKSRLSKEEYNKKLRTWVLNRYKILLSRGAKGTYIYIEDKRLRNNLMEKIKSSNN